MPPFVEGPVVLKLIGIDDAQLRELIVRTETEQRGVIERDVRQRGRQVCRCWHSVQRVAAKAYILPTVGRAELVGHVIGNIASPAEAVILRKRGYVEGIAGRCAAATWIVVIEDRFIVNVAAVEVVLCGLKIQFHDKVVLPRIGGK